MTDKVKARFVVALAFLGACLALGWMYGTVEPFWGVIGMMGSVGVYMWAEGQLKEAERE